MHKRRNTTQILVKNLPVIAIDKYINPLFQEFQGYVAAEFVPGQPGKFVLDNFLFDAIHVYLFEVLRSLSFSHEITPKQQLNIYKVLSLLLGMS